MESNGMFIGRDKLGNLILEGTEYGNLTIYEFSIAPNDYKDLCEMMLTDSVSVQLYNVRAYELNDIFNLRLEITNFCKNDTFLLVHGGWVPFIFLEKHTLLLADRNVISRMKYRYSSGVLKKDVAEDYFDAVFLSLSGMIFDITLYVLEANNRKIPSSFEIDVQLNEAREIMRLSLPHVDIVKWPNGDSYYHDISSKLTNVIMSRMNFIKELASDLNKEFTVKTRKEFVPVIFETANKNGLNNNDISVILFFLEDNYEGEENRRNWCY